MKDFAVLDKNKGTEVFRDGESVLLVSWNKNNPYKIFDISCGVIDGERDDESARNQIFQQIYSEDTFRQGIKHMVKIKRMLKSVVKYLVHSGVEFKMGITPTDDRRESAYRSLLKSGWINRYGTYWLEDAEKFAE
jgi:hypothetical protein